VRRFLRDVFRFAPDVSGADVQCPLPDEYPGLVDVLSMVDVALDRKESLAWGYGQDDLRRVREGLEYAIVASLDDAIRKAGQEVPWPWPEPPRERYAHEQAHQEALRTWTSRPRSKATANLADTLEPDRSVVVSFNYDVIVDFEPARRFVPGIRGMSPAGITGADIWDPYPLDYGVEFADTPHTARRARAGCGSASCTVPSIGCTAA
jgi:hypothetical protein